ncbi:MAG: ABC-F family ATP-binding cassette domain-containing protein [Thermoguttaceae bacterium]
MILLDAADIEKRFGPQPVLDGLSLQLRPGERAGLVGPNGSGKTTLLRILAGHEEADRGRVERHPALRLGYLEQQPEWQPGRTLWDEARTALADLIALEQESVAVAGQLADSHEPVEHRRLAARYDHLQHELQQRDAYNLDHKIERVLDGLRFPRAAFAQPVESLSGGEQNRLMLAKLLLTEPNVMLLDEPSNHLDIEATEWLETFLIDSSAAMIVVSHDRYFLDRVTQRTFELFQGTVESYTGNFSAYWQQKAERLLVQRRTYEKQQTEIAKTEDFIRRNHYGQKHAQAEDRRKKLERIERVPPPREITAPPMGFPPATRSGDLVVRAHALGKGYNVPLFAGLDLQITRGQRWGLLGPNGSGKTTLLRCLLGLEPPDEGTAELGQSVACAYFDQHLAGLDEELAVVDAVARPDRLTTTQQRRDLLARFGVTGDTALQTVNRLSGGERCRAALARLAAVEANLLVLDEPTNHLPGPPGGGQLRRLPACAQRPARGRGDAGTRRHGDGGTSRRGDAETRRGGDAGTRGRGDAETRRLRGRGGLGQDQAAVPIPKNRRHREGDLSAGIAHRGDQPATGSGGDLPRRPTRPPAEIATGRRAGGP